MKAAFVILLSILIAVSGGLLAYGAILGPAKTFVPETSGVLEAPPPNIFMAGETPNDVSVSLVQNLTPEQAADALLAVTYNSLMAERYYFFCHVDALAGNKYSCSDYFRILQRGADFFYQALTYGGGWNVGVCHAAVGSTRLDATTLNVSYDRSAKTFDAAFPDRPDVRDANPGAFARTPYRVYGLFGLPLGLDAKDWRGTDYSVMTGATVSVESPSPAAPYYRLFLSLDPAAANASAETLRRLNEGAGGKMKNLTVSSLTFAFEIWECGLFRSIEVSSDLTATLGGKTGKAMLKRSYEFSYDKKAASILSQIKEKGWEGALKASDLEKLTEREAAEAAPASNR